LPYLNQDKRRRLLPVVEAMRIAGVEDPGEINYLCCQAVLIHTKACALNYQQLSAAIAGVGDAHDELKAQVLRPYEDIKQQDNGNIFADVQDRIRCIR